MDKSKIVKKVAVPKVIPMKTTLRQKFGHAHKVAQEELSKKRELQRIAHEYARNKRRY